MHSIPSRIQIRDIETPESLYRQAREIDTLKHLVRKHPEQAMECLTFNQMLEYIQGHNDLKWIWNPETNAMNLRVG